MAYTACISMKDHVWKQWKQLREETPGLSLSKFIAETIAATVQGIPKPLEKSSLRRRTIRPIGEQDRPTEKHFTLGQTLGIEVGPEWGKFKNYCLAHDKRYANFEAAFRNWLVNAKERYGVPTV